MGLSDADLLDDGDGGGGGKEAAVAVSCSICFDVVTDNADRSWAKLQCGHQFHLDCIGSAFNIKGAMQCPNCWKVEKGQWLYTNGGCSLPEFSVDDWAHDDDSYDLSYSEMSFGVHWCPFSGLTRLPSSFDEGEFQSSAYHDPLSYHAVFAEQRPVSSTTHPCPYIAYLGPIHPSSSVSNRNVSDGSSFNNHWSGPSLPGEAPSSYAFPSMDVHYHSWDHPSPFAASSQMGSADQTSIPSATQRIAWNSSDIPRPGMHPFVIGHSSASRALSSVTTLALPPYPGTVSQPRDHPPSLQTYFHQSRSGPIARNSLLSTRRRSSSHRGFTQVPPMVSSSDQSGGFYFVSSTSSGRTFREAENPIRDHFHVWECEHQRSFRRSQVDRDSIWGPFHLPAGGSDTGIRSGSFHQRHGSGRMPSQNWP